MRIDTEKCDCCRKCMVYCPVDAMSIKDMRGVISQDLCVECSVCIRSGICDQGALFQPELGWPRVLRAQFSDPFMFHPKTRIKGRGTTEIKTNDVSNRYPKGVVGFGIEVGRPNFGADFNDVEHITKTLAPVVSFEPLNPLTDLIDKRTGSLRDSSIRNERFLSAIIECKTDEAGGIDVVHCLKKGGRSKFCVS